MYFTLASPLKWASYEYFPHDLTSLTTLQWAFRPRIVFFSSSLIRIWKQSPSTPFFPFRPDPINNDRVSRACFPREQSANLWKNNHPRNHRESLTRKGHSRTRNKRKKWTRWTYLMLPEAPKMSPFLPKKCKKLLGLTGWKIFRSPVSNLFERGDYVCYKMSGLSRA